MCGSDGLSSSSSLLICGKSCRCQAENPLNALPSFTRPALEEGNGEQADVVHEVGAGRSRLEAHIHTKGRNAVPRRPDLANSLKLRMKPASRLSDFGCS